MPGMRPPMSPRGRVPIALAVLCLPVASPATPQIPSDVSLGGGARFVPDGPAGVFSLGLRADVLFGGRGPYVPRVGPFVALRTDNFSDLVPAAGVSLLLPVSSGFPLVLSAGGALDVSPASPRAGVLARLWWGGRSYNYHSVYGLTVGLWAEARYFPDARSTADLVGGVDIDLEVFALPFILLYNWVAR